MIECLLARLCVCLCCVFMLSKCLFVCLFGGLIVFDCLRVRFFMFCLYGCFSLHACLFVC